MIRRKISKEDITCHNKPHFCFVRTNVIKMVMQSGIWPFETKNNICGLANFFLFTENLSPRDVDTYVFHRNNIYSRFDDMLTDI